jgi:hypothetical protein
MNYQNGQNARTPDSTPALDRARGGIIVIKLTIPSKTYPVQGGKGGQVKTDEMPYPYGAHGTYAEKFS